MRPIFRALAIACVVLSSTGCAHRTLHVSAAELQRASLELAARGSADVSTDEGIATNVRGDEIVTTVSGPARADRWLAMNCEPSGRCHFTDGGVDVERIDPGASARVALEAGAATLVVGALAAGTACGAGMICDSDKARTAGVIMLGSVAVLLGVGAIALATCSTCWAWK